MRKIAAVALLACGMLTASCGTVTPNRILGAWQMDVERSTWFEDQGYVPKEKDRPSQGDLHFNPDGTVTGSMVWRPNITESFRGTYTLNGRRLMTVIRDAHGRKVTATFQCRIDEETLTLREEHGVFVYRKRS